MGSARTGQLLLSPMLCCPAHQSPILQVELLKLLHLCAALGLRPAGGLMRHAKFLNMCHFGQQQDRVGVASGRHASLLLQRIAHLSSTLLPLLGGWGRLGGAEAESEDRQLKVRVL